jgi:hypothetical protein
VFTGQWGPPSSDVIDNDDQKIGNFKFDYLGKLEFIFKKVLTRGSVAHMELIGGKTRGRKLSDAVPLTATSHMPI